MQSEELKHAMVATDTSAGGSSRDQGRFFLRYSVLEGAEKKIPGEESPVCGSLPGSPGGRPDRSGEGRGPFDPETAETRPGAEPGEPAGAVQELPQPEDQHGEGSQVMGSRGPLRASAETLAARGSWRAKSRAREPKMKTGRPPRPAWLSPQGKKIWKQTVLLLEEMNVLGTADKNALARYCHTMDRWLQAREDVSLNGDTFITDSGYERRRPTSLLMNELAIQISRLEKEFGLTPASRPRLVATVDTKNDGKPSKLDALRE